ncbi:MAG: ribosome biogenesis GTPase YlqF [Firmicutes bacterium]|nr:ribosome biogenesis GTPase YlqF [Bacillota bacterium]
MQVQWFPGHMAKTLRQLKESLKLVEGLVELRDARAPLSTANPELAKVGANKKRFVVFTKADLADPAGTAAWAEHFRDQGIPFFVVDPRNHSSVKALAAFLSQGEGRKIKRYMIVGVPNVGKSTLINAIGRRASAKTGNRPGVTRGLQWISVNPQLELLDTPGLLWPKFANERTGLHLALIGSISDQRFDVEEAALHLLKILEEKAPGSLADRYGLPVPADRSLPAFYDYLIALAAKRGYLRPGGVGDPNQMALTLLKEFRDGQLGRITLELPDDLLYGEEG